jgi:hypothetical protein
MTYGSTVDEQLDLQSALSALAAAKSADFKVPQELKDKYPNWKAVLNGTETGEYQRDLAAVHTQHQDAADTAAKKSAFEAKMIEAKALERQSRIDKIDAEYKPKE